MRPVFLLFVMLSLAVIFSCENNRIKIVYESTANGIERKTFDSKGDLTEDIQLGKDSIKSGFYKTFRLGKISCLGFYKKGIKDSTWKSFDSSGNIISQENWLTGNQFGEQTRFQVKNKSGRGMSLSEYNFNNLGGKHLFTMSVDSHSKITNIKGVPLYVAYNRDNIKPNEVFESMYFFGVPPTFSYKLNIKEVNILNENTLFETTISDTTAVVQNLYLGKKYSIKKKEAESGIYDWIIIFILKDEKRRNVLNDTSSIRVVVKP
jgi:hypothetical protein